MSDTVIECSVCGKRQNVSFSHSLAKGWPECHELTMTLINTKADIESAVGQALGVEEVPR